MVPQQEWLSPGHPGLASWETAPRKGGHRQGSGLPAVAAF
jgi:hypothetical protein